MSVRFTDNDTPDAKMHQGHRSRMRAKLESYGQRIFDTYELLEMLLYYTVPYKDTNPMAKRLLLASGNLDGVFSVPLEELMSVNGVGEKTASLIKCVGRLSSILGHEKNFKDNRFSDHCRTGRFILSCFENTTRKKVIALYFDNSMNLLSVEEVYTDIDYDSAGVTAKPFLDSAVRLGAVAVITAHNHPFGSSYPTVGDRATNQMLKCEFDRIKVTLAEHYVVCNNKYTAIVDGFVTNYSNSVLLEDFIKSRDSGSGDVCISKHEEIELYDRESFECLAELLGFVLRGDPSEAAKALLSRFGRIEDILTVESDVLEPVVGKTAALFLKLSAYLTSRRKTDAFVFKRPKSLGEIAAYFKALFIGVSVENLYIMCLDKKGCPLLCERVSEGIVNSAEVLPRKLLEIAIKCSAAEVIIAHNHPLGRTTPSGDDIYLTDEVGSLFRSAGILMTNHFIISGQNCQVVKYGEHEERCSR